MAAVDLPVPNEGSLNGVTAVTVVAAPGASKQRIIGKGCLSIYNGSGGALDYTIQKNKGGALTVISFHAAVPDKELAVLPVVVGLDATDETLEAFASGGGGNSKFQSIAMETSS